MKRKSINLYSERRIQALIDEYPERLALCERAKGTPESYTLEIQRNGRLYKIPRVFCRNGYCEKCGGQTPVLVPHEPKRRSHGALVSSNDSIMVCNDCHNKEHPGPQWSKL